MNRIISPLETGMQGSAVGDLQDALKLFLERGTIEGATRAVLAGLQRERAEHTYGDYTGRLVRLFQQQRRLEATGQVDEATARAMNTVLVEQGILEQERNEQEPALLDRTLRIRMRGDDVSLLQRQLRQLGYDIGDETKYFDRKTQQAVQQFQREHELEPTGLVDEQAASRINEAIGFVVRGTVCEADGTPWAAGKLRAFHQGFRAETLSLGETLTDRAGYYEIDYSESLRRAGRNHANLFVRAYDSQDNIIATSEGAVIFNAPLDVTQDLNIDPDKYRRPAEHSRLISDITPDLRGTPLTELTEAEIALLAGERGLRREHVSLAVQAARRAAETELDPDVFYALGCQGISIDSLSAVLQKDRRALRRALEAAVADNTIADKPLEQTMERLLDLAVDERVRGNFGSLLRTSPTLAYNESLQTQFVRHALQYEDAPDIFWDKLAKVPAFQGDGVTEEIKDTLDLGVLVQNHLPMVQALQAYLRVANRRLNLRRLAKLQMDDWRERIERTGTPPHLAGEDAKERYARALAQAVEAKFPTAVVVNRLRAERERVPDSEALLRAFDRDNAFDLSTADIGRDMQNVPDPEKAVLKSWQRIFRISPAVGRYKAMKGLKTAGLDSAQEIVRLGRASFLEQHAEKLGQKEAEEVWNKASQVNGLALLLLTNLGADFVKATPKAVAQKPISDLPEDEATATLRELFGSLDFCACEHCNSVYSAAAYFVDLLEFVKHGTKTSGRSPLSVLLGRRPDLAEIELSCQNTDTRMPYVDLVNEVLENAVGRFQLEFSVPNLMDLAGQPGLQPQFHNLRLQFGEAGHPITDGAQLTALEDRQRWGVSDAGQSYLIVNEGKPKGAAPDSPDLLFVYALLRNQTQGKEEELSVQPEHLNPSAYLKLAQAAYPWKLPFDLWWEEARVYMAHLGFDRTEWIEKLPPAPAQLPHEVRIACDHLGLIAREYELITAPLNIPEEPKLWGLAGPIEILRNAKRLLQQAGFDSKVLGQNFKALRQLVHAHFVDCDNALTIRFKGDPCDLETAKLEYQGGGQPNWSQIFNRMRRFLRLQRKLGWSTAELDQAITAFKAANLDETLIKRLSNLERLHAQLKVPRLEMLAWWGTIDTADDQAEDEAVKKTPSLYDQVFLNKAVDNPVNNRFELNQLRDELKVAAQQPATKIIDVAEAVAGALGISIADLERLIKDQDPEEHGPVLNLQNLSTLYRIVSLAKALKLTVKEFLAARAVIGIDPFADTLDAQNNLVQDRTAKAREFVKQAREVQASAFKIGELDYLLRHRYEEATDLFVPSDAEIARTLAEIHAGLAKIAADTVVAPDPEGVLTRQRLALLFEPAVVDQVLNLLRWKTEIVDLPQAVEVDVQQLPDDLKEKVTYDKPAHDLFVKGTLTVAEKDPLRNLSQDPNYRAQIDKLYDKPRMFLEQEIKKELKNYLWLPDALKHALDQKSRQQERFDSVLEAINDYLCRAQSENFVKERLANALSLDADVVALMVEQVVKAQLDKTKPAIANFLALAVPELSGEDLPNNMRSRRGMVQAEKSGTHVFRVVPAANVILQVNDRAIAQNSSIDLEAGKFYNLRVKYPDEPQPKLYWQAPSTPERAIPAARLVPADAIASFRLLHKCALLLGKFNISAAELSYLTAHSGDFKQFDLNSFPLTPSEKADLYGQWRHLNTVLSFRDRYSRAKVRLFDVFAAAHQSIDDAKERLLALTDWNEQDFIELAGQPVFNLSVDDLKSGNKLDKFHEAFATLKRLGISAEQLRAWVNTDLGSASASLQDPAHLAKEAAVQSLKQGLRAKYAHAQWLSIAKPLHDELREKQRTSLAAYLVHDLGLKDINQLYDRFLIDVEMSACMMTSRIVQAVAAVQLFVQRALMGLEPDVSLSPEVAREWQWRKNYRVWEANRKVFLYPENWIEPELRDDKSPFFHDLESELLQNEVTDETVEKAFLSYLEKLNQVARLEIVGLYEQNDEWYEWTERRTVSNVLHVFGRTDAVPHIYYYRRWIEASYWTPWERVDLDIEGEHLIPVVWNRRLYLFWPIITEKDIKPATATQPQIYKYDIQFAWSEYQNAIWVAKKVYSESLIWTSSLDPTVEKKRTSFRALLDGQLSIRCLNDLLQLGSIKDSVISGVHVFFGEFISPDCQGVSQIAKNYDVTVWPPKFVYEERQRPRGTLTKSMMFVEDGKDDCLYLPGSDSCTLQKTPGTFKVIFPHQYKELPLGPLFYQDDKRTFFAHLAGFASYSWLGPQGGGIKTEARYSFSMFFHPYSCEFINNVNRYGVRGLLGPEPSTAAYDARRQFIHFPYPLDERNWFDNEYDPQLPVIGHYPMKEVEFSREGAYSPYNWEIFFHIPLLIADRLSQNQRFEEAMKWFHYIFDPTETADGHPPMRFWKVRPFYELYIEQMGMPKRIQELLVLLSKGDEAMANQAAEWEKNPFKPHLIARLRLPAYMKSVVMKYIDNLIAWGDQLFRQYTRESLNEATQLYIRAAEILGSRPEQVPARKHQNLTYRELEQKKLDPFSNVLISIENKLAATGVSAGSPNNSQGEMPTLDTLFFCIPHNDKLLKYWDTVEDRLFKIRHCMTIEGKVRELPLFQPPIEPGLLVRATAAGIDIASVLNDLYAPMPHYRFQIMAQKATELCAEVRSLGSALLVALEKKDAEHLALLRSGHEIALLKAVRDLKENQIKEARENRAALDKAWESAEKRRLYFEGLAQGSLDESLSSYEREHLKKLEEAHLDQSRAGGYELASSSANVLPTISQPLGPGIPSISYGGSNIGAALFAVARWVNLLAVASTYKGTKASIMGGHERRRDEWIHQAELAEKEQEHIEKQKAAADIRIEIAETDLKNHDLQIENAKEVDSYMRRKFTSEQLYSWMVSQISALYFQSYQLAYDLARRAEKAFQYELGLDDSNYVNFGYWDSLKKGLLAGDKLHYDLKRMEVAYLEQNRREYEITKHVSLLQLDPLALIRLRQTGECEIDVPEALFDLDCPGHFMRRIKAVGVTIPCVAGPYTGVNCSLTLLKSTVRRCSLPAAPYARDEGHEDPRFADSLGGIESIVTSSGQNDSGLFETNLRDERYLPFEGCGVISQWRIELPNDVRQFDYDTITDVILHIRYTAREGGEPLRANATEYLKTLIAQALASGCWRLFSLRHEFPNEWAQFQNQTPAQGERCKLAFTPRAEHYPYWSQPWSQPCLSTVKEVKLFARSGQSPAPDSIEIADEAVDGQETGKNSLKLDSSFGNLLVGQLGKAEDGGQKSIPLPAGPTSKITLYFNDKAITDLWVVIAWSSEK